MRADAAAYGPQWKTLLPIRSHQDSQVTNGHVHARCQGTPCPQGFRLVQTIKPKVQCMCCQWGESLRFGVLAAATPFLLSWGPSEIPIGEARIALAKLTLESLRPNATQILKGTQPERKLEEKPMAPRYNQSDAHEQQAESLKDAHWGILTIPWHQTAHQVQIICFETPRY